MTQKSELGRTGEKIATDYLVRNGYRIIERNFWRPWGEIDIVAVGRDGALVFVEVKTMSRKPYDGIKPEDHLTSAKLEKLRRVCSLYAGEMKDLIRNKVGWRIDLVTIDTGDGRNEVRHYHNIT